VLGRESSLPRRGAIIEGGVSHRPLESAGIGCEQLQGLRIALGRLILVRLQIPIYRHTQVGTSTKAECMYRHHPDHRNGTSWKSQWTISEAAELASFELARSRGWLLGQVGWGLHIPIRSPEWLGVAQDHLTRVFFAKFVGATAPVMWHGYPADHRRNAADIPADLVLKAWLMAALLSPAKIRKIARGQPCSL